MYTVNFATYDHDIHYTIDVNDPGITINEFIKIFTDVAKNLTYSEHTIIKGMEEYLEEQKCEADYQIRQWSKFIPKNIERLPLKEPNVVLDSSEEDADKND